MRAPDRPRRPDGAGAPTRRDALRLLAALPLAGCSGAAAPPRDPQATYLPAADLASGRRLRVLHRGSPVELRLGPDGPVALSLLCTHRGCEVEWDEAEGLYTCPCHRGKYDAEGLVVEGEPPRPLRRLDLRSEGAELVIRG